MNALELHEVSFACADRRYAAYFRGIWLHRTLLTKHCCHLLRALAPIFCRAKIFPDLEPPSHLKGEFPGGELRKFHPDKDNLLLCWSSMYMLMLALLYFSFKSNAHAVGAPP
jgi:hypothetical protein